MNDINLQNIFKDKMNIKIHKKEKNGYIKDI